MTSAWTTTSSLSEMESKYRQGSKDDETSMSELSLSSSGFFDVKLPRSEDKVAEQHLQKQINLLERSKHEVMVISDATAHAYKLKINSLQEVIKDLKIQLAVWYHNLG
jgi:aspartate/glutamate racemase